MVQEHERAVGGWHAEWPTIAAAVQTTGSALEAMAGVAAGLSVDPDRMRANIERTNGAIFAERAMMLLAPALGKELANRARQRRAGAESRDGTELPRGTESAPGRRARDSRRRAAHDRRARELPRRRRSTAQRACSRPNLAERVTLNPVNHGNAASPHRHTVRATTASKASRASGARAVAFARSRPWHVGRAGGGSSAALSGCCATTRAGTARRASPPGDYSIAELAAGCPGAGRRAAAWHASPSAAYRSAA